MTKIRAQIARLAHNIGPVGVTIFFVTLGIVVYVSLQGQKQAVTNGKIGEQVLQLTKSVVGLQGQIVTATNISQIGTNRLLDCTTPEGKCSQEQKRQTAAAIDSINQANILGRADLLKKVGEMFKSCPNLPCAVETINRILAEPVPVPVPFTGQPARPASGRTSGPATKTATTMPSPTPGPIVCPGIQVAPLNLARVCIPP